MIIGFYVHFMNMCFVSLSMRALNKIATMDNKKTIKRQQHAAKQTMRCKSKQIRFYKLILQIVMFH